MDLVEIVTAKIGSSVCATETLVDDDVVVWGLNVKAG